MSIADTQSNVQPPRDAQHVIAGLCLENDDDKMVSFQLTAEDYTSNEHIRLAAVLDSKLAFDRKYTCYAGEMRSYDFSGRRFQISIADVDDDEPGITVYGVSLDPRDLQLGKDDFLLLVDVLEQEKAIIQRMPALPSFKDLAAKDLLFDANWVMKFTCDVDLKDEIDSRLSFVKKYDRIDDDPYMGVDIYSRDLLIFGNEVQLEYRNDRCDDDQLVIVTGLQANVTTQDDAFLDLVNLLVELQESERLQRKLAVLMGLNPRLGQNSLFSTMDEDIACQIIAVTDGA
jgi:hypothetical protein